MDTISFLTLTGDFPNKELISSTDNESKEVISEFNDFKDKNIKDSNSFTTEQIQSCTKSESSSETSLIKAIEVAPDDQMIPSNESIIDSVSETPTSNLDFIKPSYDTEEPLIETVEVVPDDKTPSFKEETLLKEDPTSKKFLETTSSDLNSIKTSRDTNEDLIKATEVVLDDTTEETLFKKDSNNEKIPEIPASDFIEASHTRENISKINESLVSDAELAGERDIKIPATFEQKEDSVKACAVYETKEKGSDAFPKNIEVLPNPVSDVSGAECIPNFGTERKISPPLDEDVCLEDQIDICAQLKTASILDDEKLKNIEVKLPELIAQDTSTSIVDFKGIGTDTESSSDQIETVSTFESVGEFEFNILKPETEISHIKIDDSDSHAQDAENKFPEKSVDKQKVIIPCIEEQDTSVVDFKGIVSDSLVNDQLKFTSEDNQINICKFAEQVDSNVFKPKVEELVDSSVEYDDLNSSLISVASNIESAAEEKEVSISEQDCIVDFKGIITESELITDQQGVKQKELYRILKTTNKSTLQKEKETTVDFKEIIPESELVTDQQRCQSEKNTENICQEKSIKEREVRTFENIEQDNCIVDFKGVISDSENNQQKHITERERETTVDFKEIIPESELVTDQQRCQSESKVTIIPESTSLESDLLKIEKDTQISSINETVIENTENICQEKSIKEREVRTFENIEQDNCIVDFKGVISDSENNQQKRKTICEAMGSLVSTVQGSSEEKAKDVATFKDVEKEIVVDLTKTVLDKEISNNQHISKEIEPVIQLKQNIIEATPEKVADGVKEVISKDVEQDTYIVDFKGMILNSNLTEENITTPKEDTKSHLCDADIATDAEITVQSSVSDEEMIKKDLSTTQIEESLTLNTAEENAESKSLNDFIDVSNKLPATDSKEPNKILENTSETIGSCLNLIEENDLGLNGRQPDSEKLLENDEVSIKDDLTDASYHSLSEESNIGFDEESEATDNDFIDEFVQRNLPVSEENQVTAIFEGLINGSAKKDVNNISSEEDLANNNMPIKHSIPEGIPLRDSSEEMMKSEIDVGENITANNLISDISVQNNGFSDNISKENESIKKTTESVVENSIYSEADSSHFHSAREDIDNNSVFTSDDDFTDVPSHITLTEDSDRWSDVETDTSVGIEEFDIDSFDMMKEKTPTREDYNLELQSKFAEPDSQKLLCDQMIFYGNRIHN
ncbi:RBR-type E3 ubiquitin transferase [Caerostris extrusa]|uniref:RBR-type E3 ubiquitin transferase n=1 Tax=Caerostris extrusa TaxID=172846 RepID=A0AAV4UPY2_CAEEX|nr:RBR-type E3 ubiquitin transferase [Caerostris extrusa]